MLTFHAIRAFKDNYIWLIANPDTSCVAVVDPGDAKPVIAALDRLSLTPVAILITHHHWDHTGGILELLRRHSIPVYGPAAEAIPGMTHPLVENDVVQLPDLDLELRVLDVPGHTAGAIAYVGGGALLCGDTLFTAGCGKLFEGTPRQMHASLGKIAALPASTQVYCGHEYTLANLGFAQVVEPHNPAIHSRYTEAAALRAGGLPTVPATLRVELETNPFLRYDVPEVIEAASVFAGGRLAAGSEVFAAVRRWKDALDG